MTDRSVAGLGQLTHTVPPIRCPSCRSVLNSTTDALGRGPARKGDLSVCSFCGAYLIFDERLFARELPARAFHSLPAQTRQELQQLRDRARRR